MEKKFCFKWYYFLIFIYLPLEMLWLLAMIGGYLFGWKFGIYPAPTSEGLFTYVPIFEFDKSNIIPALILSAFFLYMLITEIMLFKRKKAAPILFYIVYLFTEGFGGVHDEIAKNEPSDYFNAIFWRVAIIVVVLIMQIIYFKNRSEYFGSERKELISSEKVQRTAKWVRIVMLLITIIITAMITDLSIKRVKEEQKLCIDIVHAQNNIYTNRLYITGEFKYYPDRIEIISMEVDEKFLAVRVAYFNKYNVDGIQTTREELLQAYSEFCNFEGDWSILNDFRDFIPENLHVDRSYQDYFDSVVIELQKSLRYASIEEIEAACEKVLK